MSYSTATTPRTSVELAKEAVKSSTSSINTSTISSKANSIWASIKRHAKEHHEATNAAFDAYYGQGAMRQRGQQEIWVYKTAGRN
ncbi:hypothetical protein GQ44DRAFT_717153 [Phaeosphaeriaceae sp. PMI808]|nr:hypothetical protein GQ44DRAFT_717153 [Phaeosphaeriaceae sp. PMI808]